MIFCSLENFERYPFKFSNNKSIAPDMMFFENVKLLDCYIKDKYLQLLKSLCICLTNILLNIKNFLETFEKAFERALNYVWQCVPMCLLWEPCFRCEINIVRFWQCHSVNDYVLILFSLQLCYKSYAITTITCQKLWNKRKCWLCQVKICYHL